MTIAGSPSPVKRIVKKGTFQFEISPEKTLNLQPAPLTGLKTTAADSEQKSSEVKQQIANPRVLKKAMTVAEPAGKVAANNRQLLKQQSASKNGSNAVSKKTLQSSGGQAAKHVRNLVQLKPSVARQ